MSLSIPFIIALMALAWISHAFAKMFQREVEPTRRRDWTLAGAVDPEQVEARAAGIVRLRNRITASLVAFAFCLLFIGLRVVYDGRAVSKHLFDTFYATLGLLCMLSMTYCVLAEISTRACRRNRPLPEHAMVVGFAMPASTAILWFASGAALRYALSVVTIYSSWSRILATADAIHGGILSTLGFVCIVLPYFAQVRYVKAYPYSE